jgi:hypothetical protein
MSAGLAPRSMRAAWRPTRSPHARRLPKHSSGAASWRTASRGCAAASAAKTSCSRSAAAAAGSVRSAAPGGRRRLRRTWSTRHAGAASGAARGHASSAGLRPTRCRGRPRWRRHADPALRLGHQPQHPAALPGAGRRVPVRHRWRADLRRGGRVAAILRGEPGRERSEGRLCLANAWASVPWRPAIEKILSHLGLDPQPPPSSMPCGPLQAGTDRPPGTHPGLTRAVEGSFATTVRTASRCAAKSAA